MTNKQPEALRLADSLEQDAEYQHDLEAAAELRRLHEVNAELVEALKVVVHGVPDTWGGVVKAKAALAKAQGDNND